MTVRTIDDIFRDFVVDGVPASGPFNPHKPDIRDTLKALLEGLSTFPDNRVIRLNNANEGTANKIVVTASVAIPAAAFQVLYILNVTQENTGPVTVSGAINRALVTNTGAPIPSGYLTPGMAVLCIDTGSELRMLSYGDIEAVVEELVQRAEAAAQAAEAAAGNNWSSFDTVSSIQSSSVPSSVNYLRTAGYYEVGRGGAVFVRVNDEPAHSCKVQSADGAWFELSRDTKDIQAAGVKFDGVWNAGDIYTGTDNTVAIENALTFKSDWVAPAGVCLTRGGHVLSGTLIGSGVWDTTFVCTSDDPGTKVFTLHTLARIDLFRTIFNGDVDVTSAADEQFVALAFGTSELPLCKGGGYGSIAIGRCGTAMWSGDNFTFACRFDNLEARDFTYRLLDVPAGLRTPNKWGNIYASGPADRIDIDVAINQSGSFSDGDHFGVVHIEKINFNSVMRFSGCVGTRVDVIHLEDVNPKATDRCLFEHRDGATAHYGRVSIWYSIIKNNCTLFGGWISKRQGDALARLIDQDAFIRVDHLELNGLYGDEARTLPVNTVAGFKAFNNYTGEVGGGVWYAGVSEYTWYSYNSSDDEWYKSIGIDDGNMRIERFGKLKMPDGLKSIRTLTASGVLTRLDNVIIVSAASGNIIITLPKTIAGKTREIVIRRVDTSGNTVSYAAQSGNTVNVANTPALGTTRIISDGFSGWLGV